MHNIKQKTVHKYIYMLYKYNMTYILFVYVISIAYKYTIYVNYM